MGFGRRVGELLFGAIDGVIPFVGCVFLFWGEQVLKIVDCLGNVVGYGDVHMPSSEIPVDV